MTVWAVLDPEWGFLVFGNKAALVAYLRERQWNHCKACVRQQSDDYILENSSDVSEELEVQENWGTAQEDAHDHHRSGT